MGWLSRGVVKDELEEVRAEIKNLRVAKKKVEEELEGLKLKKRLEAEEIRHMTKINEERLKSELETKRINLEKEFNERISKFREEQTSELLKLNKELHGKLEGRFNVELGNLKDIYKALMDRLPNVNFEISKNIDETRSAIEHKPKRKK